VTPDLYLLLLEHGQEHERTAIDLLESTLGRLFPGRRLQIAIVDNALKQESHTVVKDDVDRISGDNTLREFSGWDHGITWLERHRAPAADSIVALANDTVVRPEKAERIRCFPVERAAAAAQGALVGWVEEYPRPVGLFDTVFRQWVDTSLVVTTRRTLKALGPLAVRLDYDRIFDDDWRRVFREPSPLSANYRRYLRTYFLGDCLDREFTHGWYAQAPVTPDSFDGLKTKLRCVFCEQLLSARARMHGIPLVDIRPRSLPIDPSPAKAAFGG
jgi:hypothetical protein